MADRAIVAHEEVRDSLARMPDRRGTVRAVAEDLAVSPATAGRYLERLVVRGWATRTWGGSPGHSVRIYRLTPDLRILDDTW